MRAEEKKRANYFCKIAFIALVLVAVLLVANRYFYGTWNPFTPPSRINCFNRRYYPSIRNVVLTGKAKPVYLASVTQLFFGNEYTCSFLKENMCLP